MLLTDGGCDWNKLNHTIIITQTRMVKHTKYIKLPLSIIKTSALIMYAICIVNMSYLNFSYIQINIYLWFKIQELYYPLKKTLKQNFVEKLPFQTVTCRSSPTRPQQY